MTKKNSLCLVGEEVVAVAVDGDGPQEPVEGPLVLNYSCSPSASRVGAWLLFCFSSKVTLYDRGLLISEHLFVNSVDSGSQHGGLEKLRLHYFRARGHLAQKPLCTVGRFLRLSQC